MPQSWPDYGDITVTTRESAKYPHHKSLLFYIVRFSKLCALAAVDGLILTILRTPLKDDIRALQLLLDVLCLLLEEKLCLATGTLKIFINL